MKHIMLLTFVLLIASAFYSSCKKEKSLEIIIDSTGIPIDTTGNGNDTTATGNDSLDYQPTSSGSFWNFTSMDSVPSTVTLTATPNDTMIDNKPYYIFTTAQQDQNGYAYIHKENGNYSMRGTIIGASLQSDTDLDSLIAINPDLGEKLENLEILYLKDNVPVGTSWIGADLNVNFNNVGIDFSFRDTYTFTIAEKGISKTVDNRTFQNVIHEKLKLDFSMEMESIPLASFTINGDYYVAKDVGIIQYAYSQDSLGLNENYALTDYSIK